MNRGIPEALLLAGIVVAIGADLFRMGFFADDFHFLDVARRMPVGDVLLGRHGIAPWYRPLSRELFFYLVVWAGPAGVALTRVLNMACLLAAGWALYRVGARLFGRRAGITAAVLFVTYSYSKLFVSWASGFQDLLVSALALTALADQASGRTARAVTLAVLAMFSKESGFLVAPLVLTYGLLCERKRRIEPWMTAHAIAWVACAGLHLAVRATWPKPWAAASEPADRLGVLPSIGELFTAFVSPGRPPGALGAVLGLLAGACATLWSVRALRTREERPHATPRAALAWCALGLVAGAAPILVLPFWFHLAANVRLAYPAVPFLALILAATLFSPLPRLAWQAALVLLACANVWGLGFRMPDLESPAGWQVGPLAWPQASAVWARSERLMNDLRSQLPAPPESLLVLFNGVPAGSWIQTEDGPATREALRDRTARSFYINEAPRRLQSDRLAIVAFDPVDTHHFQLVSSVPEIALLEGLRAMVEERAPAAYAWGTYCDSSGRGAFFAPYLRALAVLMRDGPDAYHEELARAGWGDSSGAAPAEAVRRLAALPERRYERAFELVLRSPRSAAAHAACAESLAAGGTELLACLELRAALGLQPGATEARLRLGSLLAATPYLEPARRELERAAAEGPPAVAARARERLDRLPAPAP